MKAVCIQGNIHRYNRASGSRSGGNKEEERNSIN